jgi:DNA-binding NtrC family response regulator
MAFNRFSHMTRKFPVRVGETVPDKKPLIEVIDDDPRIREGLKLNLQKTYQVRLCADGEQGINSVDEDVAVVILDLKMPGKNGLQVYAAIKARFPNLPVIFYSAYQGVLEGTTGDPPYKPFQYLDKSANIQELLSVVDQAVHYAQTIRQVAQPTTPVKKNQGV